MATRPVPEGYNTVMPYLLVKDAAPVIDFLEKVFDGRVIERMPGPNGGISHAEVKIGDSVVMMGEPRDVSQCTTTMLYVYLPDVDAVYRRALAVGAASIQEPRNEFYGDRTAAVRDSAGNQWYVATHVEDVPPDELARRAAAARA